MWEGILYLKAGFRRPVRRGPIWPLEDAQGAIPVCWCSRCGAEVFSPEESLCCRCRSSVKGADQNENKAVPQSLSDLYKSPGSQRV